MPNRLLAPCLLAALLAAPFFAAPAPAGAQPADAPAARLVEAWPGVRFSGPVGVVHAGDGSDALYVVEQPGRVQRIEKWRGAGPVPEPRPFLDVSAKVFTRMQGGLLGLAFHPRYRTNGRLFVCYLVERPLDPAPAGGAARGYAIVVAELRGGEEGVDPASERVLLEIPKSEGAHNAGCLAFGPDAKLYVSTGDNRRPAEAKMTSQNPRSLLGKILRLEVDHVPPGRAYGIPPDNPWAGAAAAGADVRPEIWAFGFRNPWRFSFDERGDLWLAEPGVAEGSHEWVTRVVRGANHGWPYFEGSKPIEPAPAHVGGQNLVHPVFEYVRGPDEDSTAAIGGYVYRGDRVKDLRGWYVFGDYGRGHAYAVDLAAGPAARMRALGPVQEIASLGEDAQGELYFCAMETGVVWTLAP